MSTMNVSIVSQEKSLFEGLAIFVSAMTTAGEVGILPHHISLLGLLTAGQVRITLESGTEEIFWVSGGIIEVQPNQVMILADMADRAVDIDEVAVHKEHDRLLKQINDAKSDFDYARASAQLSAVTSQIDALERLRKVSNKVVK